jgi:hypothetical protein
MFPLPVPRQPNLLPSGDLAVPFIKKQALSYFVQRIFIPNSSVASARLQNLIARDCISQGGPQKDV